jgi:hypothetical protein
MKETIQNIRWMTARVMGCDGLKTDWMEDGKGCDGGKIRMNDGNNECKGGEIRMIKERQGIRENGV